MGEFLQGSKNPAIYRSFAQLFFDLQSSSACKSLSILELKDVVERTRLFEHWATLMRKVQVRRFFSFSIWKLVVYKCLSKDLEAEEKIRNKPRANWEGHTQKHFPETMMDCYPNLFFHDTHLTDHVVSPLKPDVTVTCRNLPAHSQTALAFIELKSTKSNIDSSAKGEVISAVNQLHHQLFVKRDIYGFALNVSNEKHSIFIYLKMQNGMFPLPLSFI